MEHGQKKKNETNVRHIYFNHKCGLVAIRLAIPSQGFNAFAAGNGRTAKGEELGFFGLHFFFYS